MRQEGLSASAADSFTNCFQDELVRLTKNVPAEQFNVPDDQLMQMGENLRTAAANNCIARITG